MKFTTATVATILAFTANLVHANPTPVVGIIDETAMHPEYVNCPADGLVGVSGTDQWGMGDAANQLSKKGGDCVTPAGEGKCIRVACYETSGIWMCNTNGHGDNPKTAKCHDVAAFVWRGEGDDGDNQNDLFNECARPGKEQFNWVSGQAFAPGGDWNIIGGYANCKKPATLGPNEQ